MSLQETLFSKPTSIGDSFIILKLKLKWIILDFEN